MTDAESNAVMDVALVDPRTGYLILVLVGPMGALNGYVGVPPGHRLHGVAYDQCLLGCAECDGYLHTLEEKVQVYGRVTFSGDGVPALDAYPGAWWFGFDTAHAGDYVPALGEYQITLNPERPLRKWGPEEVAAEALALSTQLKAFEHFELAP